MDGTHWTKKEPDWALYSLLVQIDEAARLHDPHTWLGALMRL